MSANEPHICFLKNVPANEPHLKKNVRKCSATITNWGSRGYAFRGHIVLTNTAKRIGIVFICFLFFSTLN